MHLSSVPCGYPPSDVASYTASLGGHVRRSMTTRWRRRRRRRRRRQIAACSDRAGTWRCCLLVTHETRRGRAAKTIPQRRMVCHGLLGTSWLLILLWIRRCFCCCCCCSCCCMAGEGDWWVYGLVWIHRMGESALASSLVSLVTKDEEEGQETPIAMAATPPTVPPMMAPISGFASAAMALSGTGRHSLAVVSMTQMKTTSRFW